MHSITDNLLVEQCPQMIYVRKSGAAYMLLGTVLQRVNLSERALVEAGVHTLNVYGNRYLPVPLIRPFLIQIADQLSEEDSEEASKLIAMSVLLLASIQALRQLTEKSDPLLSPFNLVPDWPSVQELDDLAVGVTPIFGAGLNAHVTVNFDSQSVH